MLYLALGDSYTIGEAVSSECSWPFLLASSLGLPSPVVCARTGWTTAELLDSVKSLSRSGDPRFDIVSLLVGVNDQYRGIAKGYSVERYVIEFEELLSKATEFVVSEHRNQMSNRVFVVSIPDYGVTPFSKELDAEKIYTEIQQYNDAAKEICRKHKIRFINITELSRKARDDETLTANDNLHPSGLMYRLWVEQAILPEVKSMLSEIQ
jgi:lysophospholipase L1-like esterase